MTNWLKTVAGVLALTAGSISWVEAADYENLSNDELVQMRSQAREMVPEDRKSYRTEMQTRMQSMSSDERALYRDMNKTGGPGDGARCSGAVRRRYAGHAGAGAGVPAQAANALPMACCKSSAARAWGSPSSARHVSHTSAARSLRRRTRPTCAS